MIKYNWKDVEAKFRATTISTGQGYKETSKKAREKKITL